MQFPYLSWARWKKENLHYQYIGDEGEYQSLDGESKHDTGISREYKSQKPFNNYIFGLGVTIANVLLFLSTIAMIFIYRGTHCTEAEVSSYSPIFDRLDIYRSEYRHNFTNYWRDNNPSIFQQPPSPEVDAAWERISSTKSIALSTEEVRALGYDPDTVWPAPADEFGEGVYFGVLDVFHQLHCLDMLRRTAWPSYYGDMREKKKNTPLKWEDHLLHCTYDVMRSIMCHADVEVIVGQKFKGWPGLNLNFASTKKCRNFEEILDWKETNTIHQKAPWSEYPDRPIIEMDPEGILTPYGDHSGLEEYAASHGIDLDVPDELEWQPHEERPAQ